ncbi:MAG: LPS assembly lipoprotein LptE [Paracoccaceae bacterium]
MSWFSRLCALGCLLVITACGFEPVNRPEGTAQQLRNAVLVTEPAERDGFLLVRRLEERLGRSNAPRYRLSYNLNIETVGLGIDSVGNTNRFNLRGTASYVLSDIATRDPVASGTVNSFTGYAATDSTVATLASERDARERLMLILADQITARLLATGVPE